MYIYIHIYERCVCCQVSLGRNGFNCETNSWQPRRLLRPWFPLPPPDLFTCPDCVPPHLFNRKGQTAGLNEKSALLFCLWPTPVVMEPLRSPCPRVNDKLGVKIFRNSDWSVQEDLSTNKLLSTGEAGWSGLPPHTLQYSKMAHRKNTGLLVGYICFKFIYMSLFPLCLSFHIYSWRIFKRFSRTCCWTSCSDWPIAASLVYFSGYRRLKYINIILMFFCT